MATFTFGRDVNIHWNGFDVEGSAGTVFSIPDQLYEEFEGDFRPVEPSLTWIDTNEFQTLENNVSVSSLSATFPIALATSSTGKTISISSSTSPNGYLLAADGSGGVIFTPASTSGLTSVVGVSPISAVVSGGTVSVSLDASYQTAGTYVTSVVGTSPISATGTTAITVTIDQAALTAGAATTSEALRTYVKNTTGSTITKGQAVYITGADGTNALIGLASASADPTSSKTLGIAANTMTNNAFGYVIENGQLSNIDTSAATAGSSVWLGATPGSLVFNTPPAEPDHAVYLGVVTKANVSTGEILVKVQNGYELDELHDVFVGGVSTALPLVYNSTSSGWVAQALTSVGIADNAVVAAKINNGAVGSAALADNAVVAAKIAAAAVGAIAISSGSSTTGQILQADGSGGATFATLTAGISASTFSAKGDIISASASGTIGILQAGSNGKFLVSDSNQSLGLKYTSLAVLQNPSTSSSPEYNVPSGTSSGTSGNYLATDGTTIVASTGNRLYTSTDGGATYIAGSFFTAINSTLTGGGSVAYGDGKWWIAVPMSGSFGQVSVRYSTNLTSWTELFTTRSLNNMATAKLFFCNATTKTLLVFVRADSASSYGNPLDVYAVNTTTLAYTSNIGGYQNTRLPYVTYSSASNQFYFSTKNSNENEHNVRYGTPNGNSTTISTSTVTSAVNNNDFGGHIIVNDSHSAVYVAIRPNTVDSWVAKATTPLSGSSSWSNVSGTFGYGIAPYWNHLISSGNNVIHVAVSTTTPTFKTKATIVNSSNSVIATRTFEGRTLGNGAGSNSVQHFTWNGLPTISFGGVALAYDSTDNNVGWLNRSNSSLYGTVVNESDAAYVISDQGGEFGRDLTKYTSPTGHNFGYIGPNVTTANSQYTIYASTNIGSIDIIAGSSGLIWTGGPTSGWTERTSGFSTTTIRGLASNGSLAVAVGDSGKVASSNSDGSSWTIRTSGTTSNLNGVAFGAGIFVAVGSSGTMIQSSNGTSWSSISSPFGTATINAIVYSPRLGIFAAGANGGTLATSSNGTSWTLRTSGISTDIVDVVAGASTFAIGFNQSATVTPAFRYSYDGITWTAATISTVSTTSTNVVYANAPTPFYIVQTKYTSGGTGTFTFADISQSLGNGSVIGL